jgi:hypothetical protein
LIEINKKLKNKENIQDILKVTDTEILKKGFGFTHSDIKIANGIWNKLLKRRLLRGKPTEN